jgi:di/tricarboxylate transporter
LTHPIEPPPQHRLPEPPLIARGEPPLIARGEPPLIERARRIGWALLGVCLLIGGLWRFGGAPGWVAALAVACGLLGLLAIVNVALVRGLYRQLDVSKDNADDQSM